jgi:hypothetical protein
MSRRTSVTRALTTPDFQLWPEPDGFPVLANASHGIVHEALQMKDENWWEQLDEHLLGRLCRDSVPILNGNRLDRGKSIECILNSSDVLRLTRSTS